MRTGLILAFAGGLAQLGVGQVRGIDILNNHVKAFNEAQTLKSTYLLTMIGGTPTEYTIELGKPKVARLENPTTIVVADGKEIFTYDKPSRIFYRQPQTDETFGDIFGGGGTRLFAPFYDARAYASVVNPKSLGTSQRKGMAMEGVRFSYGSYPTTTLSLYMPKSDYVLRQAEIVTSDKISQTSGVVDTRSITLGDAIVPERFAWVSPAGSLELPYDLAVGKRWFDDVPLAKEVSRRTKKILFMNFFAASCPGCQALKAGVFSRPELRTMTPYFVLCEVDIEKRKDLARSYGATTHPVFHFYRHDGTLVYQEAKDLDLRDMVRIFKHVLSLERLVG